MMSKWFVEGNVSEESDNNQEQKIQNKKNINKLKTGIVQDLESSQQQKKRQKVKTQKQKRYYNLKKISNKISEKMKINDFVTILQQYENLLFELKKTIKTLKQSQFPQFIFGTFIKLQQLIEEFPSQIKSKLGPRNNKCFNTLKQKIKKDLKQYSELIDKYKNTPEQHFQQQQFVDEKQDSSSQQQVGARKYLNSNDPMLRVLFWIKKQKRKQYQQTGLIKIQTIIQPQKKKDIKKQDSQYQEQKKQPIIFKQKQQVKDYIFNQKISTKRIINQNNADKIFKQILNQIIKNKKSKLLQEYINQINQIKKYFQNQKKVSILKLCLQLKMSQANESKAFCMTKQRWQQSFKDLQEYFNIIKKLKNLKTIPKCQKYNDQSQNQQDQEDDNNRKYYKQRQIKYVLKINFIYLQNELNRSFMVTDPMTSEYGNKLTDMFRLIELGCQLYLYYKKQQMINQSCQISFKCIQNIYYLSNQSFKKVLKQIPFSLKTLQKFLQIKQFNAICKQIIEEVDSKSKSLIILYNIYFHALHNLYQEAKNGLLALVLQSKDRHIQIIYNRVLAQLGLAAFKKGQFHQVTKFLSDLCNYGKTRQMLFQYNYKNAIFDCKKKRVPFHQYICIDEIEQVQMIASILQDSVSSIDSSGKAMSKSIKKIYDHYEKTSFLGNPNTFRDKIYRSLKQLQKGNWQKSLEQIISLKFVKKNRNDLQMIQKLSNQVKQGIFTLLVSLKCYLIVQKDNFITIGLGHLQRQFELDIKRIKKIVYSLIYNKELKAKISGNGYLRIYNQKSNMFSKYFHEMGNGIQQFLKLAQKDEKIYKKKKIS